MKAILFSLFALLSAGCYPIHKTLQPAGQVTVLNQAGEPVSGANVYLIANSYPYGREKSRNVSQTDNLGKQILPL